MDIKSINLLLPAHRFHKTIFDIEIKKNINILQIFGILLY